jgi:Telomere resolvase
MIVLNEKSSMPDIVKRAKELGITEFIHEGANAYLQNRMKAEYKQSLLIAIQKFEQHPITTQSDENDEYLESSTNQKIEEIKTFIRDSIQEITFAEKQTDFDKLYNLLGTTPSNIISRILEIGTTANTATKYRSQVFSDLEREYNNLEDGEFKKRFVYFLKNLRESVYKSQALTAIVQEKRELGNARLKERKADKTAINPEKLIIWSVETLSNLESYNPTHWKPVTQAIKLLTGRRTSEILSSGRFIPSTIKGCLLFKGQNKKHSEDSFKNEQPLLIPVIGGHSELVLQAMQWLELSGKRIKAKDNSWSSQMTANVLVNKNLAKYLSDYCKGADGFKTDWYGKIETNENVDWSNKKKPDCTRDIYTQIMGVGYYNAVKQELSATLDFLSQILGHSGDKSIIKYDVDFVVNYKDIQKYMRDIDLKAIPVK